jgi:hypothetical protein
MSGFIAGQRIIYAAEYSLAGGSTLIVWFDRDGNDANGHNCHSDAKRRIVTAKPGEAILHKGEPRVIKAVRPYRENRLWMERIAGCQEPRCCGQ